jgi:hypothetical protein
MRAPGRIAVIRSCRAVASLPSLHAGHLRREDGMGHLTDKRWLIIHACRLGNLTVNTAPLSPFAAVTVPP